MKRTDTKSHCPINFTLEAVGDSWSLLIVRDIAFHDKRTFRELLRSDEGIASNILAARLTNLMEKGIITKSAHKTDRRKEVYALTEKGQELVPLLLEMTRWGARYDPETTAPPALVSSLHKQRTRTIRHMQEMVRRREAIVK